MGKTSKIFCKRRTSDNRACNKRRMTRPEDSVGLDCQHQKKRPQLNHEGFYYRNRHFHSLISLENHRPVSFLHIKAEVLSSLKFKISIEIKLEIASDLNTTPPRIYMQNAYLVFQSDNRHVGGRDLFHPILLLSPAGGSYS